MYKLLELLNKPYWTWETRYTFDYPEVYHKNENGNDVYYLSVPGFNKDNLKVSQVGDVIKVQGERESKDGIKDKICTAFSVNKECDIDASVTDGILRIELIGEDKSVRQIELK